MKYCEEYAALLDGYADGELSPREMAQVQEHLTRCPGCQAYLDDILAIRAAFPAWEDEAVPQGFADGVMEAVRATPQRRSARWTRTVWVKALAAAACFAVILQCGLYRGGPHGANQMDNAAPAAYAGGEIPEADLEESAEIARASDTAKTSDATAGAPLSPGAFQNMEPEEADHSVHSQAAEPAAASPAAPQESVAGGAMESASGVDRVENAEDFKLFTNARRVAVPADQASLLASCQSVTDETGRTCYRLDETEYAAFLEALAERGVYRVEPLDVPKEDGTAVVTAGAPEGEQAVQPVYLVYVTWDQEP